MSIFPSWGMSQSSHSDLMTQAFCDMALVMTTGDFKRLTKKHKRDRRASPLQGGRSHSKIHAPHHPGRQTEQLKSAS